MEWDYEAETLQRTKRAAVNDNKNHEYRIRHYQREKLSIIPIYQSSVIISWRTYNAWRDLTPEWAIPRTESEVYRRLRVSS